MSDATAGKRSYAAIAKAADALVQAADRAIKNGYEVHLSLEQDSCRTSPTVHVEVFRHVGSRTVKANGCDSLSR